MHMFITLAAWMLYKMKVNSYRLFWAFRQQMKRTDAIREGAGIINVQKWQTQLGQNMLSEEWWPATCCCFDVHIFCLAVYIDRNVCKVLLHSNPIQSHI